MGRVSLTGRGLPALALLACLIPTGGAIYRAAMILAEGDYAFRLAPDHVDAAPLLVHALASVGFITLGAVQILPGARRANMRWHRAAGRYAFGAGLLGALSGVWMTLLHPGIATEALYWARLVFGLGWALALVMALRAVLRRDLARHRAFMIRAFAIAINAGTLPFLFLPAYLILGDQGPDFEDNFQIFGWLVNLAVAEWIIRRPAPRSLARKGVFQ